jgi:hypothetical protein
MKKIAVTLSAAAFVLVGALAVVPGVSQANEIKASEGLSCQTWTQDPNPADNGLVCIGVKDGAYYAGAQAFANKAATYDFKLVLDTGAEFGIHEGFTLTANQMLVRKQLPELAHGHNAWIVLYNDADPSQSYTSPALYVG